MGVVQLGLVLMGFVQRGLVQLKNSYLPSWLKVTKCTKKVGLWLSTAKIVKSDYNIVLETFSNFAAERVASTSSRLRLTSD